MSSAQSLGPLQFSSGRRAAGIQWSPFKDGISANWIYEIKDVKSGEVLMGDTLTPYLIDQYGFYQGGVYRKSPLEIINFFNLVPDKK
jgi:hypothetical protein